MKQTTPCLLHYILYQHLLQWTSGQQNPLRWECKETIILLEAVPVEKFLRLINCSSLLTRLFESTSFTGLCEAVRRFATLRLSTLSLPKLLFATADINELTCGMSLTVYKLWRRPMQFSCDSPKQITITRWRWTLPSTSQRLEILTAQFDDKTNYFLVRRDWYHCETNLDCNWFWWYIARTSIYFTSASVRIRSFLSTGTRKCELYQPVPSFIGICTLMFSRGKKSCLL